MAKMSLEQFVRQLTESGLLTSGEMASFTRSLPAGQRPADADSLARALVQAGRLTQYQASAAYLGKAKGLVFGEYRVLDKIGQGGMGLVLKAEHRRMKRVVAIKVLPAATMKSPEAVRRFYREVEAAAKLSHPNIVTAYDASEHQGMHYLVMEFVDGRDLASIIKQHGAMPVRQAVECVLQTARGLQYAHEQGIIHRDIKPGNLLLDKKGTVKILDMGLARMEQSAAEEAGGERLTRSGQIMGTCDYMAPEQALDTHSVDARADIYSLGCTLYRLLTGKTPYQADSFAKLFLAHLNDPIPRLCEARPDVPPALEAVYQKMMAKRPEDRQPSMREVIAELQTCVAAPGKSSAGSAGDRWMQENLSFLRESTGAATAVEKKQKLRAENTLALEADRRTSDGLASKLQAIPPRGRILLAGVGVVLLAVAGAALLAVSLRSGQPRGIVPVAKVSTPGDSARSTPAPTDVNRLTEEEERAGFELLFNGRDLRGWEHGGNWQVEDGAIFLAGKGGDITCRSRAIPDDFELRFAWKVAAGTNSGVFYHASKCEYQVLDNDGHRDGQDPRKTAASLFAVIGPSHDATRPIGQWNAGRIVCRGTVIEHWLNGEKVVDFDDTDPRWSNGVERLRARLGDPSARGGFLSLQDRHTPVWYRAIKLRALAPDQKTDRARQASDIATSPAPDAEGFLSIFDGKTLNGWDGDPAMWRVEDGAIVGEAASSRKEHTFLIWRGGEVDDCDLRFEFRLSSAEGNSGVQYRSVEDVGKWGRWVVGGYQFDIDAQKQCTGELFDERGRTFCARRGEDVILEAGGKRRVTGQVADPTLLEQQVKTGDWNSCRILARGFTFQHEINGYVTAKVNDQDEDRRRTRGLLAFQLHKGWPIKIEFRNIRQKRLGASPATGNLPAESPLLLSAEESQQGFVSLFDGETPQ